MNKTLKEGGDRPLCSTASQNADRPAASAAEAPAQQPAAPPEQSAPPALPSGQTEPLHPAFTAAALVSYPLAYLYTKEVLLAGRFARWGMPAFALLFVLGVGCFARALHRTPAKETPLWAGCYLALSAVMPLWGAQAGGLATWQALAWHFLAVWYVLACCGMLAAGCSGILFWLDGLAGLFILPWADFLRRLRIIWQTARSLTARRGENTRHRLAVLGSALLALALCAFAWGQLVAADANFAVLSHAIGDWWRSLRPDSRLLSYLVYFLLSLPVGAWLYGLVAGSLLRSQPPCPAAAFWRRIAPLQKLPGFTVNTVLAALCGVYALFFGLQAAVFLTAGRAGLSAPDAASFAVDGFWELCRILLLNFAVLAAIRFFAARPAPRPLLALFAAFGVDFALLDGAKLLTYIRLYGYTPRRVVSGWFLCVLLIWTVLALVRLFRPIPAARWGIAVLAVSFTLLSCVNMNRRIIRANIDRYAAGVDAELDTSVLRQCGLTPWDTGMLAADDRSFAEYTQWLLDAGWFEGRSYEELCRLYLFGSGEAEAPDGTITARLDEGHRLSITLENGRCTAASLEAAP